MDSQTSLDFSLAYIAFFIGVGTLLAVRWLAAQRVQSDAAAEAAESARAAKGAEKNEAAVRELRDVAQNMACDVNAHRLLVESVSERLGDTLDADTKDEQLILDATMELLDANFELQCRLSDAEQKIRTQEQAITLQQRQAETDPLTKLANRRAFDARLDECQAQLGALWRPFSLVMLDIDYFKQFNDAHGHVAGDDALRTLGALLPTLVKRTDVVCRFGGEEFAVILRGARLLEAQTAANRIRAAIESMALTIDGNELSITASLGVAEAAPGLDCKTLIARADQGVYASKRAGRNCCHWHNGTGCVPAIEGRRAVATRDRHDASRSLQPLVRPTSELPVIPDRAVMVSLLQRRVAESARSNEPLAVLQVAVHKQRSPSEHEVDEAAVESLVTAITSSVRDMDYVGRWSAQEYTIILPRCTEADARGIAERVAAAVRSADPSAHDLSIGLSAIQHPMTAQQIIDQARSHLSDAPLPA